MFSNYVEVWTYVYYVVLLRFSFVFVWIFYVFLYEDPKHRIQIVFFVYWYQCFLTVISFIFVWWKLLHVLKGLRCFLVIGTEFITVIVNSSSRHESSLCSSFTVYLCWKRQFFRFFHVFLFYSVNVACPSSWVFMIFLFHKS